MEAVEQHGVRVLSFPPDGPVLSDDRQAVDLIALARPHRARLLVLPVSRLHPDFFTLRTGMAGAIVQKFVQYRMPMAFLGDITEYLAASSSLRAFVYEANRGKDFWFVADKSELDGRLARAVTAGRTTP